MSLRTNTHFKRKSKIYQKEKRGFTKNVWCLILNFYTLHKYPKNTFKETRTIGLKISKYKKLVFEFIEFEPRLKSANNWFKLSAGLNSLNSVLRYIFQIH